MIRLCGLAQQPKVLAREKRGLRINSICIYIKFHLVYLFVLFSGSQVRKSPTCNRSEERHLDKHGPSRTKEVNMTQQDAAPGTGNMCWGHGISSTRGKPFRPETRSPDLNWPVHLFTHDLKHEGTARATGSPKVLKGTLFTDGMYDWSNFWGTPTVPTGDSDWVNASADVSMLNEKLYNRTLEKISTATWSFAMSCHCIQADARHGLLWTCSNTPSKFQVLFRYKLVWSFKNELVLPSNMGTTVATVLPIFSMGANVGSRVQYRLLADWLEHNKDAMRTNDASGSFWSALWTGHFNQNLSLYIYY